MDILWSNVAGEFDFDGSWRDIYVHETTTADWQSVLDALSHSGLEVFYTRAGTMMGLPTEARDAFPEEGMCDRLLTIRASGVTLCCHFFDETQIEFDIDPREVTGQEQLDAVLAFMRLVASATSKPIALTPENAPTRAIFLVKPDVVKIEYNPCFVDVQ